MTGESNLDTLLKTMKPKLNVGEFVFCSIQDLSTVVYIPVKGGHPFLFKGGQLGLLFFE
jgi:hypothetical protein